MRKALTKLGCMLSLSLLVSACSDVATSPAAETAVAHQPRATLIQGTQADILESFSLSGNPTAGSIVNLNFSLTNVGLGDYAPTFIAFGETRPRAAFGEIVLPPGLKRQLPVMSFQTDNPYIQCEAYRGTHGGLTQSLFNDICRVWYFGTIAAGASVTATIPVKLVGGEGDFTTWGGAEMYPANQWGSGPLEPLNGNVWMPFVVHVNPAPPKVGTVGGLPDLQAGGTASTKSPAAGSAFYLLMTAKNSGKIDATNPTFTATVPAGLTITYATLDYGACTVTGQLIACSSAHPVFPGMTFTAAIYLTAPTLPGTFTTSGTWADANGESSTSNNTSTVIVTVK